MCLDTKETKFPCCKDYQPKQKMALFYSFIYFIFGVIFRVVFFFSFQNSSYCAKSPTSPSFKKKTLLLKGKKGKSAFSEAMSAKLNYISTSLNTQKLVLFTWT